jgi:multicomponent Na+:H+ antiporter subunit F
MNVFIVSIVIIAGLCIANIIRAVMGPTIWDRLLCLSMFSAKVLSIICLLAVVLDHSYYLDAALAFAVLAFIGNVYLSRYVIRRRKDG